MPLNAPHVLYITSAIVNSPDSKCCVVVLGCQLSRAPFWPGARGADGACPPPTSELEVVLSTLLPSSLHAISTASRPMTVVSSANSLMVLELLVMHEQGSRRGGQSSEGRRFCQIGWRMCQRLSTGPDIWPPGSSVSSHRGRS